MNGSRDEWAEFWRGELASAEAEAAPLGGRVELVEFVSASKGKGKRRRRPVTVRLMRYGSACYQLGDTPGKVDRVLGEIIEGERVPAGLTPYRYLLRELGVSS